MTDSQAFQEQYLRLPDSLLVVQYTGQYIYILDNHHFARSGRRTEHSIIDQPRCQPRLNHPVIAKLQLSDSSVS